jgi:hypothetical protein
MLVDISLFNTQKRIYAIGPGTSWMIPVETVTPIVVFVLIATGIGVHVIRIRKRNNMRGNMRMLEKNVPDTVTWTSLKLQALTGNVKLDSFLFQYTKLLEVPRNTIEISKYLSVANPQWLCERCCLF